MSRALDALVATEVMGWTRVRVEADAVATMDNVYRPDWMGTHNGTRTVVPRYSTDIAAAWEAMQRFARAGGCCMIEMDGHTGGHALVTTGTGRYEGHADSPAVAACIAMLRAVGVDEDTIREASDP